MVLFVEIIELTVMHRTMSNVKKEFFGIEEEEELPDHCPNTRTSLGSHENFKAKESVSINEARS